MTRIPAPSAASAAQRSIANSDAINKIDLDIFLKLMIAELQNQDPLNPLDNKDMLAQISQIREVGATDRLTNTLDAVLLGQNIASATNLIGADVTALSDTSEAVEGVVRRVAIDNGVPKLQVENLTKLEPSPVDGNVEKGTYSYRVVWENPNGELSGIEFSGDNAITTTGTPGVDTAVQLRNLPVTTGPKRIFRTDSSGTGAYQLVGTLNEGSQQLYVDTLADKDRTKTYLTEPFQIARRFAVVSMNNVSAIRPPGVGPDTNGPIIDPSQRPPYSPPSRPAAAVASSARLAFVPPTRPSADSPSAE